MEHTEIDLSNQEPVKKKITHIRIPVYLKRRLDKIRKDTGKQLDVINADIIQRGLKDYYSGSASPQ